ncbi:MAG: Ldh family oxidoreductase [Armatimonadetes bacterium]|nr:Ldh family oxidoreductase [Armatimonadota bacterium]
MPLIQIQVLEGLAEAVFVALSSQPEVARHVADCLTRADRAGHPSHGVIRVLQYAKEIREGRLVPTAAPVLEGETEITALVDGRCAFGQITASFAVQTALQKARTSPLAAVGTRNTMHFGRLGDYAETAALEGCIALMWGNGMFPGGRVAPFGGRKPVLGTNPMAMAVPRRDGPPIVSDFSTASIAEGKVRVAAASGQAVPSGCLIDAEGKETTDPSALYRGGALLTFGGHKGFGLSVLCDVLAGLVTGNRVAASPDYEPSNGLFVILIDPGAFRSTEEYYDGLEEFCHLIESVPPAEGFSRVMLPGEPEQLSLETNKDTVSVADSTWEGLVALAQDLGLEA